MKSKNLSFAENINTPADKLRELAAKSIDPEVLRAIARNPNTPPDILAKLSGEYLEEIGSNPALDLILIENPNFIEEVYYVSFNEWNPKLYSKKWLPDWFLKLGVKHSEFRIRALIAINKQTPISYLELLSTDEISYVRYMVAKNKNISPHIVELLSRNENKNIRLALAENINTPAGKLEELAKKESRTRAFIARNPNAAPDLLVKLAGKYLEQIGSNPALDLILIENPNFVEDIYYEHFHKKSHKCSSIYLPDWFLKLCFDRPIAAIIEMVAKNKNIPVSYLEKLANDEKQNVRESVAQNKNTPCLVLEQLANDDDWYIRTKVANKRDIPSLVLEQLATDEHYYVRKAVAQNKNTPSLVLEQLATDEHYYVRKAVAQNKNTPSLVLEQLATDEHYYVRKAVAQNKNTPSLVLEQLATDEEQNVRAEV